MAEAGKKVLTGGGHDSPIAVGQQGAKHSYSIGTGGDNRGRQPMLGALANPEAFAAYTAGGRGCSSGVEHHVANVRVVGSNPIARSSTCMSDPETWVTKRTHDIGDTVRGCRGLAKARARGRCIDRWG